MNKNKNKEYKRKVKYIVLFNEGTCGHKHRNYGRAIDCLDKFEDNGISGIIVATKRSINLLWIEHCLLKHTDMYDIVNALEA